MSVDTTNSNIRRERFVRLAEKRVNKIIYNLDNLGKCSNKKNYQYSELDIKRIFKAIEKKVREVRNLFQDSPKSKVGFKLEE